MCMFPHRSLYPHLPHVVLNLRCFSMLWFEKWMPICLHLFSINIDTHGHSLVVKNVLHAGLERLTVPVFRQSQKNAGGDICERLGETWRPFNYHWEDSNVSLGKQFILAIIYDSNKPAHMFKIKSVTILFKCHWLLFEVFFWVRI